MINSNTNVLRSQVDVAVDAVQSVSGLAREQAKTCVYYAVMTHLLDTYPDDFLIPILCFQGNSGTGKSQALKLMAKLVKQPAMLNGRGKTFSDIATDLDGVTTALIEEADFKQARVETQLLQQRTERRHRKQIIHKPPQQVPVEIENYGATIVEKRVPFSDAAVRNRTITVKTVRREGDYREVSEVDVGSAGLGDVCVFARENVRRVPVSDRVMQSWRPLIEIAGALGDFDWVMYLDTEYQRARKMLAVGDQYESEDVLIKAAISAGALLENARLTDVRQALEQMDVKWSTQKVHTTLTSLGLETKWDGKYDRLVNAGDPLRQLAKERNIPIDP